MVAVLCVELAYAFFFIGFTDFDFQIGYGKCGIDFYGKKCDLLERSTCTHEHILVLQVKNSITQ